MRIFLNFQQKNFVIPAFAAILLNGALIIPAHADLVLLNNDTLQSIAGQGGADLSLVLQLNQDASTGAFTCGGTGTPIKNCRLGVSFNNRDVTALSGGSATTTGAGYKTWLVFKGIQGYLNLQQIGLDGSDLTYKDDNNVDTIKGAIMLTFTPTKPILLRNFGFNGLAVQTDDTTTESGATKTPGYLGMPTSTGSATQGDTARDDYTNGYYTKANSFDGGTAGTAATGAREAAFMGLTINGNLALSGTIKIFGCDASHPRC